MRAPGASGLIAALAIRAAAPVWAQCPANESVKLTASDSAIADGFGPSVSISGDTAIVGARGVDGDCPSPDPPQIPGEIDCGAAYILQIDTNGTWAQVARLTAADAEAFDEFGYSVSISGATAIVGAHRSNEIGIHSGSASIFRRDFGGPDNWGEVVEFVGFDTDLSDNFGAAVSFDGETALVGARFDDDGGSNSGSAYLFDCVSVVRTIIPISQQRSTNASVSYEQCGNQSAGGDMAEGFDPRDSAVETALACGQSSAQVAAGQQSQIDASSMTGSGHTFLETTGPDSGEITAAGDSFFEVTIELPSVMGFALDGFIIAGRDDPNDDSIVGAAITLTGPNRRIIFAHSVSAGTHDTIDEVGALSPGLYTLVAAAAIGIEGKMSGAAMGESSFAFTIDFALLGDLDVDGDVDLVDFANWGDCFTGPDNGWYLEGCGVFDFGIDDDIDFVDFAAFQVAFTGN